MHVRFASLHIAAIALVVGVGTGCGSSSGCTSLKPLPAGLAPFGIPSSQVIEGGVQARLTEPGLAKFSGVVGDLLTSSLTSSVACLLPEDDLLGKYNSGLYWASICPVANTACTNSTHTGCDGAITFDSSKRPAPYNVQDNVDGINFTMADGTNPVMTIAASFDIDANVVLDYYIFELVSETKCNIEISTPHYRGAATAPNLSIAVPVQLGIDPTTGKLTITAQTIVFNSVGLTIDVSNCGDLESILKDISFVLNDLLSALNNDVVKLFANTLAPLLQPQINAALQKLLPNPLGLANTVDTQAALAAYDPPATPGLETYLVPGGYVAAKDKGLTLGVLAGMNSDHDPTTRTATTSSEPDPCVPSRPVPALGAAPWSLPANATRQDFTLAAAASFAGMPDPVDSMGNVRDVLLGVSRTYFDLIGFHIYNSGSLCLHVDGSTITQLSTGTIGLLIPSLSTIALDPKAPMELVLRPQKPITFTMGAGTSSDALLHVAINDLRIDMYAWIEERWVRVLTLDLDLNLGINFTVTKDANMNPILEPMITGLTSANVSISALNTDLLQESSATISKSLGVIINVAASQLTSALPKITLPAFSGFSLDDLSISRVQTTQDDFLGIFGTIMTPTSPAPLIDWTDPQHPRLAGELRTHASIFEKHVPTEAQMAQLLDPAIADQDRPARPSVTLLLSADGANGAPIEYAWKVDNAAWQQWTTNTTPTLTDDALLLQAHHTITVRSRIVGDYRSEDSQPVSLDALLDSVAPGLNAHLDDKDSNTVDLDGWDLVSDADHLDYSWRDASGVMRPFGKTHTLSVSEVGNITHNGAEPLLVSVRDEAGNVATIRVATVTFGHGSWGRVTTASGGCGCDLGHGGGSVPSGAVVVLVALGLWLMRRRSSGTLLVVGFIVIGAGSTLLVGCGNDRHYECTADTECSNLGCDGGIPSCQSNACVCESDITLGQTGRYASMTLLNGATYVAAYNATYGDLMIGHTASPGVISNWDFVDGVPDVTPDKPTSHVRGGVSAPGPNVGSYTSIAVSKAAAPIMAYFDTTDGALKFASFGAIRWRSHIVDQGAMSVEGTPDAVGTWTSLTLDKNGNPGIAYTAIVTTNTASGMPEGQLRFAQASTPDPQQASDWSITIVDKRALPNPVTATNSLLPDSIAIMTASARKQDGTAVIAYYDRYLGNLRLATQSSTGMWTAAIIDGQAADGTDTGDVGQYPSLLIDASDVVHISYVDASHDNLLYIDTMTNTPVIVDDGYRPDDEMTDDGLPSPVYHLVGDSSQIAERNGLIFIAYQDSTAVELRLANRDTTGKWTTQTIAGHAEPFTGSYGFWAGIAMGGTGAYVGSYAINQQKQPEDFFYQTFFVDFGFTDIN